MANVQSSNSIYVDSVGSVSSRPSIQVTGIIFTPSTATDSITLTDGSATGATKIVVKNSSVSTLHLRLGESPILFANGIYVSAISTGAVATLITRNQGSNS